MIVDFEHLGGVGKHIAHLADHAIRGDDRHIRLEAVSRTFVDDQHARQIGAAGADDMRGHCFRDVLLLEAKQFLQSQSFASIDGERGLFHSHAVQFRLQLLILLADMTQIHVVMPGGTDAVTDGKEDALEGRKGRDHPIADEASLLSILAVVGATNLYGEAEQLHQHDRQQDQWITVAAEKRFHGARATAGLL